MRKALQTKRETRRWFWKRLAAMEALGVADVIRSSIVGRSTHLRLSDNPEIGLEEKRVVMS